MPTTSLRPSLASALLFVSSLLAHVAADPAPEKIRFPVSKQAAPTAVGTLTADRLYVIDSDVPLLVIASPDGVVSVTEEPGPIRMRGRFVDGNGKTETRNYKGKHVFSIEAVSSGRVELLIIPVGSTKTADVIRKTIDVDAGDGPRPPPDVDPKPDPKPEPKAAAVWVVIVHETATFSESKNAILGNAAYWQSVTDRGHKWRHYDKDAPEAKANGYADRANAVGLPCLLLVDQAGGKVLKAVKLPSDTAGIDKLIADVTK